ncbi:MAG: stage II sporulation protein R [Butyricicoccus sp.]
MTITRKRMECTIALTLVFVLGYSAFCQYSQHQLAEDIVRLRVIANSDSEQDQQTKLAVRDAVLEEISGWNEQADSAAEMMSMLEQHEEELRQTVAAELDACGAPVSYRMELARDYYPTRTYDTFSLPAGQYQGLRIFLGEGEGHNWWCVVYPSLCLDPSSAEEELTEDERGLIHQDSSEYVVRFRTVELLGELRQQLCPE